MMETTTNTVTCNICGDEHDRDAAIEVDSTHLCPSCTVTERRYRTGSFLFTARKRR
jgi:transposase